MSLDLLKNKTAIITGASSGLGFEIAQNFLSNGANIILCGRSETNLEFAVKKLNNKKNSTQEILSYAIDISDTKDIDYLLEQIELNFNKVDILVNNAGTIGPIGNFENLNWEDWLYANNVNFIGSAYLIKELIPKFKSNNYGKIIQISGGGATSPLPNQSIYAASKAAIVRLVETIARELDDFNITANCIAPGQLNTKILQEYIDAGAQKLGDSFYKKVLSTRDKGGAPIHKAVNLALYLASDHSPKISGKLFSAIWDDWENMNQFSEELKMSDVYTLRRITAKDRSFDWGDL